MTKLDKKNDPDWCYQFFAPFPGIGFLAVGVVQLVQPRTEPIGYWHVCFGLFWLGKGFIHAAQWRRKKQEYERAFIDCFK